MHSCLARISIRLFAAAALWIPATAGAGLIVYEDISNTANPFRDPANPIQHVLLFRTDATGSETFAFGSFKTRPGSYFSDLVRFSSPSSASPGNVLWGHFDGNDGGIGSLPNLLTVLRLDFASPVAEVGFRNRGIQPGINVQYFATDGHLIGQVVASASSFVGASSTEPVAFVLIQQNPPLPSSGQSLQPAFITDLEFNAAQILAIPEPSALLAWLVCIACVKIPLLCRRHQVRMLVRGFPGRQAATH